MIKMDKRALLYIAGTVQGPNKWHVTDGIPASAPTVCTTPQLRMHSAAVYISENLSLPEN